MNKSSVINFAYDHYKKRQESGHMDYTAEDAVVHSLEEHNTGYDLTQDDYDRLVKEVEAKL